MNLQDAADRLGVHYQTAYRWVREGRLTAVKVHSSYEVTEEELTRFLARRAVPAGPPERVTVRSWDVQRDRLFDALVAGDELEARAIVDRLHALSVPLLELCEELLAPAIAMVGGAWHRGEVSIAVEHRATAIVERVLARVSTNPRGRPRGTAVVVAPPGDMHSLPGAMAALVLRDDRWKVHHLGSNLPVSEIVDFSKSVSADMVVLSLTFQPIFQESSPDDRSGPYNGTGDVNGLVSLLQGHGYRVLLGGPGKTLSDLVAQARGTTIESDTDVHNGTDSVE
jgi:MerR family transcriptional regulator, light-induced transcriptional regulator